jgi:hypothetical protein
MVPPSGGSLEIGNYLVIFLLVPPSGGSLEIGNLLQCSYIVPPSGGSLEIGNYTVSSEVCHFQVSQCSPFGGIPRNWKLAAFLH